MAIRPDRVEPHELLSRVRFRQSRDVEGMTELQKCLEIFPTSTELRLQLASAHIKRNELREALVQYQAVLKMTPEDNDGLRQSIALLESRIAQNR